MERLLTINEVAELLGYGKKLGALYMMVHRREIPLVRLGPKKIRFRLSDLEAFIAARVQAVEIRPAAKPTTGRRPGRPRKQRAGKSYIDRLMQQACEEGGVVAGK